MGSMVEKGGPDGCTGAAAGPGMLTGTGVFEIAGGCNGEAG